MCAFKSAHQAELISLHRLLPFTPFFSDFLFTPSTFSCFSFSCLPAPLKFPLRRGLSLLRSSPPMNLLHWLCCMWHVSLMACLGGTCHSHTPPHLLHLQQIRYLPPAANILSLAGLSNFYRFPGCEPGLSIFCIRQWGTEKVFSTFFLILYLKTCCVCVCFPSLNAVSRSVAK